VPYVEVSKLIRGPVESVYRLASDMEAYPRFMEDVLSVTVLERRDRATVTEWVTRLEGRILKWKELDEFDEANWRIRYRQLEGDLKKFEGEWVMRETPDGTQVTLTVDFELGIPMFAALLNPIAKLKVRQNCESMLEAMRRQVEEGGAGAP